MTTYPAIRAALELEIDRTRVRLGRLECDLLAIDGPNTPTSDLYEIGRRSLRLAADQMVIRHYAATAVEAHAACSDEVEAIRRAGGGAR